MQTRNPVRYRSSFVRRTFTRRSQFILASSLVALAGLLIGASALMHHPSMQVEEISVLGVKSIDPARVSSAAHRALRGDYISLFPRSNTYLLSDSYLAREVEKVSSRIESVEVERDSSESLVLHVTEREPIALWCGELPQDNDRRDCSYVDSNAVVFDDAPEFSAHVFMKVFGDVTEIQGTRLLVLDRFAYISSLAEVFEDDRFVVEEAWIKDREDFVLKIEDPLRREWTLQIRDTYEAEQVLEDLKIVLNDIETNEPHADIDYIDMRFGERVYYKLAG